MTRVPESGVAVSRWVSAGVLAAASLTLLSCASEQDPSGGGAASESDAAQAPDAAEGTEAASENAPAPGTAACLYGVWNADNDYFLGLMREFGPEAQEVTGQVSLTFDEDGSIVTQYSDWRLTFTAEGHQAVIVRDGSDTGTFEVDGDRIDLREHDMASKLTMKSGGQTMQIAPEPVDYRDASFTCDGAEATIATRDGTVILSRAE